MGKIEVTTSVTKEFPVDALQIGLRFETTYGDETNSKDTAFTKHREALVEFKDKVLSILECEYKLGNTMLRERKTRKEIEKTNHIGIKGSEKTTTTEETVVGYYVYTEVIFDIKEIDREKATELVAFLNKSHYVSSLETRGYIKDYESAKDEVRQELCAKAKKQAQDLILPLCKEIKGVNLIKYNTGNNPKALRQNATLDCTFEQSVYTPQDITFAGDLLNTTLDTPVVVSDSVFVEFEVQ
jgi:hypothetical protein